MIKIYKCNICGNIITKIYDSNVNVVCCNEEMKELIPNTIDASFEKHIPVVTLAGHMMNIKIGEINHPMDENHFIQWILLETKTGIQLKYLKPFDLPEIGFTLIDDNAIAVYSYCNIHGLWKKEIN